MNILELRNLLRQFNGTIVWKSGNLDFKIEYFKGVGYLNKPIITINGNVISDKFAFSTACTMFRNFKMLLSLEQFNQLKFIMFVDNIFNGEDENNKSHTLYELIRFDEEVVSRATSILLIDETVE